MATQDKTETIVERMTRELRETEAAIRERIAPELAELEEIATALAGLTGKPAGVFPPSYAEQRSNGSGARIAVDDNAIINLIKTAGEPIGAQAIAERLGYLSDGKVPPTMSNHLKALTESGAIKRQGERRATRYLPA